MNTHISDALERYSAVNNVERNVKVNVKFIKLTTSVNALNINFSGAAKVDKSQYCSLCTGRGDKVLTHSTYNCSVYPNPSSKKERLQSFNGCIK